MQQKLCDPGSSGKIKTIIQQILCDMGHSIYHNEDKNNQNLHHRNPGLKKHDTGHHR